MAESHPDSQAHHHPEALEHDHFAAAPPSTKRKLAFAVGLTMAVLVGEVAGGLWSHSLALLSDAAHVLTDLVSLILSLGALLLAARPVSKERTFGWHRAEVFAALVNGGLLLLISAGLLIETYHRLVAPEPVRIGGMLIIAVAGLLANGLIALRLRGHAHDLNVHSAYLHVLADLGGSAGVVVAGVIMFASQRLTGQGWFIADPILSGLIALAVLVGSVRLLRDTVHILLEGVPRHVDLEAVAEAVRTVPQVQGIHDLHIWTICSNLLALSVHVTVGDCPGSDRDKVVREINHRLSEEFGISETTVQVEGGPCRTEDLIHIVPHRYEP